MKCGHVWEAPYIEAPRNVGDYTDRRPRWQRTRMVRQECALDKDHAGPHRSLMNVTKVCV